MDQVHTGTEITEQTQTQVQKESKQRKHVRSCYTTRGESQEGKRSRGEAPPIGGGLGAVGQVMMAMSHKKWCPMYVIPCCNFAINICNVGQELNANQL